MEVIQIESVAAEYPARLRDRLGGSAPSPLTAVGNLNLLALPKTALFCSARCPGGVILPTYDQAARWRDAGRCVISGFHSPVEEECLQILLRGDAPVILCPARGMLERLPAQWAIAVTAGRLLLLSPFTAHDPVTWSPNLTLRIVSYPSDKQSRSLHEQTLQGPAVSVLRQAVSVIQQQTGFSGRFKSGRLQREDRPAYAVFALREGLVNAIVHRNYQTVGGQLRVEIFPEHLIIQNPGCFPAGWTDRDILTKEESHPINPDIARVFYLRNLMERLGLGGRKLDEACRALKAKRPVWKAENGVVSLTLFRAPSPATISQLSSRQREFHHSLTPDHNFKADEYAKAVGVSVRQARRDLMELEEFGLLVRTGKGPATLYRLVSGGGA